MDASDPLLRADLDRLRARIEWNVGSVPVAHRILLAAADEVVGIDVERARVMTLLATAVASFVPQGAEDMSARMAALGDAVAAPDGDPRRCARLLAGFVHVGDQRFDLASRQLRPVFVASDSGRDRDVSANIGVAALHLGDDRVVLDLHARQLAEARENGALVAIVHALTRRSFGEIVVGDWTTAEAGAAEALDLAASGGPARVDPRCRTSGWRCSAALRYRPEPLAEHLAALNRAAHWSNRPESSPTWDAGPERWPRTLRPARCTTCNRPPPS